MYDLNDDGYISREEMFQMLKNTMPKQLTEEDPDEGIKEIVEGMVKRMVRKTNCCHYVHGKFNWWSLSPLKHNYRDRSTF